MDAIREAADAIQNLTGDQELISRPAPKKKRKKARVFFCFLLSIVFRFP
jgi:hypothetical protein